jgi:hypothetical protein
VNKKNGHFTKSDEESFETFAVYCGLGKYYWEKNLYQLNKHSWFFSFTSCFTLWSYTSFGTEM